MILKVPVQLRDVDDQLMSLLYTFTLRVTSLVAALPGHALMLRHCVYIGDS